MTARGDSADEPLVSKIADVDVNRANPARVYDYWLGGAANFAIDRDKGDEMIRGLGKNRAELNAKPLIAGQRAVSDTGCVAGVSER